jgi:ATP adenylyltransferase
LPRKTTAVDAAPLYHKDSRSIVVRTVFGKITLQSPRFWSCECDRPQGTSAPWNLLVTRRWMLVVPRLCEGFEGVAINALGFAGSLFVRDDVQLETIKRAGPMTALRAVSGRVEMR